MESLQQVLFNEIVNKEGREDFKGKGVNLVLIMTVLKCFRDI